jgi:hypothetical protein
MTVRMLVAFLLISVPRVAEAQRTVPVHEEPRHRLVYESEALRVLDVQIQPGDTTLFHTHEGPITYVTISRSTVDSQRLGGRFSGTVARTPPPGRDGEARSVLSYADEPLTHRVTNVGSTLYRLVAVATRTGGSVTDPSLEPLPGAAELDSEWFRVSRLELSPGEQVFRRAVAPVAVVLIRPARVAIHHADGWTSTLEAAGQVRVIEAAESYRLENAGDAAVEIVLVEVR